MAIADYSSTTTTWDDSYSSGLIDDTEDTTDTTETTDSYSTTSTDSDPDGDGDYDSYGVRDMDQDVSDGADTTTGEISGSGLVDAIEDGDVEAGDIDPNAEVGGTDTQVDGDPADDPENTTGGLGEFNAGVGEVEQAANEAAQVLSGEMDVGDISTAAKALLAALGLAGAYIAMDATGTGA